MSIAAYKRVWDHSQQLGTDKLLLLALAEFADDQGLCWPSVERLARMIGVADVDYAHKLIKKLIKSGEILHKRGGGRGRCSIYAIVCGMTDSERASVNTVLQYSVIRAGQRVVELKLASAAAQTDDANPVLQDSDSTQNTVPENTVLQNTVLQSGKTLYYSLETGEQFEALERGETAQITQEIHHEIHDDDDDARQQEKRRSGKRPPAHVRYLAGKGMKGAHLFVACDADAAIKSFDNLTADGWDIAGIVKLWKDSPPSKENIYERRQNDKDQPQRSAACTAQPAQQRARAASIGTPEYYTRRSAK